jgi:hypothetical protein
MTFVPRTPRGREEVPVQISRLLHAHEIVLKEALIAPPELIAIHTNMPGIIPPEIVKALAAGGPPPADLGLDEKRAYEQVADTLILVGLQRGPHKVLIEVVDSEGAVFTKQTVSFDAPGKRITYDELLRHAAF